MPTGITISGGSSVSVGEDLTLTAVTVPATAAVNWSSSDEDVATVADGVVTGVSAGYARITAELDSDPTKYDTKIVEVTA